MTRLPTSSTIPIASLLSSAPGASTPLSFIYASHSRWPLPPDSAVDPVGFTETDPPVISVLDSSFNPPHAAHRALAETTTSPSTIRGSIESDSPLGGASPRAQLLTFTISNADKRLNRDELYHRLEMVRAMAIDLNRESQRTIRGRVSKPDHDRDDGDVDDDNVNVVRKGEVRSHDPHHPWDNVAVAVLDAATFVKKAEILQQELPKLFLVPPRPTSTGASSMTTPAEFQPAPRRVRPKLVFPVGWDTLIRIFAPRYYPPPGPDLDSSMETLFETNDSRLVCARRRPPGAAGGRGVRDDYQHLSTTTTTNTNTIKGTTTTGGGGARARAVAAEDEEEEERNFMSSREVERWVRSGHLTLVNLERGPNVEEISSTEVRNAVKRDDWNRVEEMVPFPSVVEIMKRERLYR